MKGVLYELIHDKMGLAGLAILAFLVVTAIYAVITLPPDFPQIWNNPKAWAKYPKNVPPSWAGIFGYKVVPQYDVYNTTPDTMLYPLSAAQVFTFTYVLKTDAFPSSQPGILVYIHGYRPFNVTYDGRTVSAYAILNVTLIRPDGEIVNIITVFNPNITGPYAPDANTIATRLVELWQKDYGISLNMSMISMVQQAAIRALFAKPLLRNNTLILLPLKGTYKFIVRINYFAPGVPPRIVWLYLSSGEGGVSAVELVVSGNAYGLSGTDVEGHDLALGLLYGFPVALLVGIFTAAAAVLIGLFVGVVSGYYGGWIDEAIQRLIDVMANIPILPILVLIGYIVQSLYQNPWVRLFIILGVLVLFSWGGMAIVVRAMTLSIRAEPYIETARAIGASNRRIIFRYILPQIVPYAFASMVFSVPSAILTEAGLEVLGIHIGLPGWGSILSSAEMNRGVAFSAWWWVFPPGILLAITSLAFVLLGIALETIVEPRLKAGR